MRFRDFFINNDNGLRGRVILNKPLPDYKAENDELMKDVAALSGPITSYTLPEKELEKYRSMGSRGNR